MNERKEVACGNAVGNAARSLSLSAQMVPAISSSLRPPMTIEEEKAPGIFCAAVDQIQINTEEELTFDTMIRQTNA